MRPADPLFQQWADTARAAPIADVAAERGLRLRGGVERVGSCPAPGCGGRDRFGINTRKNVFACRQCGVKGGPIDLVMLLDGCTFMQAAQMLAGSPPPSGGSGLSTEELAKIQAERIRKRAERDVEAASYSEAERERLYRWWCGAAAPAGTAVEAYLRLRGLDLPPGHHLPSGALRYRAQFRLYDDRKGEDGETRAVPVHTGPAMFAAILGPEGRFAGLHITWIDLSDRDGKTRIPDPATGELAPAKKIRGSQTAGRIELVRVATPRRVFIGEGIETTLSVRQALMAEGEDLSDTAFWASLNLGNLGGRHVGTVPHPTQTKTDAIGRVRRAIVPSGVPDLAAPAIPIPDSVAEVITLGDGDSEAFLTRLTHERAAARWARPGRTVRAAFAPEGADFNSLLREACP